VSSPFPGMDPYLELPAYWSDFHYTFINYWREAIADALPPAYEAALGERVYLVEHDPEARRLGYPDIAVTDAEAAAQPARGAGAASTLEPDVIPLGLLDGPRETYIEILHQPERRLVAALELLSPANKEQPGRTEYLTKRRALLHQDVHLVELDLLFGGKRSPLERPLPKGDYYYLLSRADQRPNCQVYHWRLKEPLPTLPVPLRAPDSDIQIDLGAVFATTYERGRYRRRLPYSGPVPSHIPAPARPWVASLIG
jgi:hypothetical protein